VRGLSRDRAARLQRRPHGRQTTARTTPSRFHKMSVDQASQEIEDGFGSLRSALGDPKAIAPFFSHSRPAAPEFGRAVPCGAQLHDLERGFRSRRLDAYQRPGDRATRHQPRRGPWQGPSCCCTTSSPRRALAFPRNSERAQSPRLQNRPCGACDARSAEDRDRAPNNGPSRHAPEPKIWPRNAGHRRKSGAGPRGSEPRELRHREIRNR